MEGYQLVFLRWVDVYEPHNTWHNFSDIEELVEDDWIVEQTRWVWEESAENVILINMVSEGSNAVAHITKIPKSLIKYREDIHLKCQKRVKIKNEKAQENIP